MTTTIWRSKSIISFRELSLPEGAYASLMIRFDEEVEKVAKVKHTKMMGEVGEIHLPVLVEREDSC